MLGSTWYSVTRGSEPSLADYGGHCKAFGFCINEKEAAGAFEQRRDRIVYVLKGLSGCCIEYKHLEPTVEAGFPLGSCCEDPGDGYMMG